MKPQAWPERIALAALCAGLLSSPIRGDETGASEEIEARLTSVEGTVYLHLRDHDQERPEDRQERPHPLRR